ncbi:hypothetical protein MTQ00_09175 [Chryseobacterium sp. B21-037]|uniref:hypothetical protein n=1 Tax=Chryseobacterium sp. B21-037 TaxID=2926038 RepID=UPI002359DBA8|nr:hypothetical protein [Chryseobacterium sp. B21-037]MDC8104710.1 hypothetical protein [Chryseobacterium sp. B21-037]
MNSERQVLYRLLKLFPVKVIKDHFQRNEVGEALYREVLNSNINTVIYDFAYLNLDFTKQHIYVFNIDNRDGNVLLDGFPYEIVSNRDIEGSKILIINPFINYNTVLSNPFEQIVINFHQPIKLEITNEHLIFYVTIVEKNISTYVEEGRKVYNVEKNNDEYEVIRAITDFLTVKRPRLCDLNRGLKKMWEDDVIDCKYAQWKKSKSTTTETMDENYTLKSQYADVYRGIITAPLKKTIFKYLLDDGEMPEHFTADPGIGQISIPLFPKSLNQNQNVVKKILSDN